MYTYIQSILICLWWPQCITHRLAFSPDKTPEVRREYARSTPEIHPRPAMPFNTPQVCLHVFTPHEYPWKPQYIYVNFVAAQWANGLFCYPDYTGSTPGVRRKIRPWLALALNRYIATKHKKHNPSQHPYYFSL